MGGTNSPRNFVPCVVLPLFYLILIRYLCIEALSVLVWRIYILFSFFVYWLISEALYSNKTKLIVAPLNPKMKVFHPNLCTLFSYISNGNLTEHFRNPLQSIVIKLEISGVFIITLFQLKLNKNNQDDIFQIWVSYLRPSRSNYWFLLFSCGLGEHNCHY